MADPISLASGGRVCDDNDNDQCDTRCCNGAGSSGGSGSAGGFGGTNPLGGSGDKGFSSSPIQYSTGTILLTEVDTAAKTTGFRHAWIYRNSLSGGKNYDGPNVFNWDVEEWPYLVQRTYGTKITINARIGNLQIWFDKVGSNYIPRHSKWGIYDLQHDASAGLMILTRRTDSGVETIQFQDFDQTSNPVGLLKKRAFANGDVVEVTAYTGDENIAGLVFRRASAGATDSVFALSYSYFTSGLHNKKLDTVTLNELDQYPNPTATTPVRRTRYVYYDGSNAYGSNNDLEAAFIQQPTGNAAPNDWHDVRVFYYRYYKGGDRNHMVKYAMGTENYSKVVAAGQDPLAGPPSGQDYVPEMADYYFEYDSSRRATKEIAKICSACGSSGGTSSTGETFQRFNNANYPKGSSKNFRYNQWMTKTVSVNDQDLETVVYTNRVNRVILKVKQQPDQPAGTPPRRWIEYFEYDDHGREILHAHPSAVSGYDESFTDLVGKQPDGSYSYLRANEGLIERSTFYSATTATSSTPGGARSYLESNSISQGAAGTQIKTAHFTWYASDNSTGEVTFVPAEVTTYPDQTNQDATKIVTSYDYQWYALAGNLPPRLKQRTTNLPVVPTSQNGDGASDVTREYFDTNGNLTWMQDARGILTRRDYGTTRELLIREVRDADTGSLPPGWSANSGTHFNQTTDYEYDLQGRRNLMLGPEREAILPNGNAQTLRSATYTVHVDADLSDQALGQPPINDQIRTGRGYATGTAGSYTFALIDPVTIVLQDKYFRMVDTIVSKRSTGSGRLNTSDTFLRADWCRWSKQSYTIKGQQQDRLDYFDIPAQSPDQGLAGIGSDLGTQNTNYELTLFGYDSQSNRRIRSVAASGTITRTIYDALNRPIQTWVGTDDVPSSSGATWEDWVPGAAGTNLVLTRRMEYDHTLSGGNSNLTCDVAVVDDDTGRVTRFEFDFRNRRVAIDGEETEYRKMSFDNMDRPTGVNRHDSQASGNLIGRTQALYDNRSRVYRTIRYGVDPADGSVGNALTGQQYYDAAGNLLRSIEPAAGILSTWNTYDNLNRLTTIDTGFEDASATGGKVIVTKTDYEFDLANNSIEQVDHQLDTGATPASQTYRTSYAMMWFDSLARQVATTNYGALSSAAARPGTPPASSDTILVHQMGYNDRGELFSETDPKGLQQRTEYDDLGRTIRIIENWSGTGVPASPNADDNRTTETAYGPGGHVVSRTAVMANSADNQVTTYVYGSTLDANQGSKIASDDLLVETVYADGNLGSNSVRMAYNRQSQVIRRIDQAGTTHEYWYDGLGRLRHDSVTARGNNIHSGVLRLTTQYEVRGMVPVLSSCQTAVPNPSGTGGGVVNQVKLTYNNFGQLVSDQQSHGGSVGSQTRKVTYSYNDGNGSANQIRPLGWKYPDGHELEFVYSSSTSINDKLNRPSILQDDVARSGYQYLGMSSTMVLEMEDPPLKLDLWGGTVGSYDGLDRFGRITDMHWKRTSGAGSQLVQLQSGYDRNSNRLWQADPVAQAASKNRDQLFAFDGLDRLTDYQHGQLNGSKTGMNAGTLNFQQSWNLDPVGNWSGFDQDDDGNGTFDLVQQRTSNKANEITGISETSGPAWTTPGYDLVGNAIDAPQPVDPTKSLEITYDAWNRVVKLWDPSIGSSGGTIGGFEYDARGFRIVRRQYDPADGSFVRKFDDYFSGRGQRIETYMIEEPAKTATQLYERHVWHACADSFVDQLWYRDRDTTGNGQLNERLFALYDNRFSIVALTNDSGTVQERFGYDAYGTSSVFDASFNPRTSSNYDWTYRYTGRPLDLASGLYYFRARYYHPQLGIFITRDPLEFVDGMSLYRAYFVPGAVDPTGLCAPPNNPCKNCKIEKRSGGGNGQTVLFDGTPSVLVRYESTEAGVAVGATADGHFLLGGGGNASAAVSITFECKYRELYDICQPFAKVSGNPSATRGYTSIEIQIRAYALIYPCYEFRIKIKATTSSWYIRGVYTKEFIVPDHFKYCCDCPGK